jgi:hypothetical protein
MANSEEKIDAFFHNYAERFNCALEGKETDIDASLDAFTDCFIESSPAGVQCNRNGIASPEGLPESYAFYRKIGTTCMVITSREITVLDDCHAMVKVRWKANYSQGEQGEMMEFDSFYFLTLANDEPKIFAYITGSEQKLLKERGIIPKD